MSEPKIFPGDRFRCVTLSPEGKTILGVVPIPLRIRDTFAISILNIVVPKDWVLTSLGISNTTVYFLAALFHGELHHIILTFVQYMYTQPTYVNVYLILAFANTHDLSWGTKGLDNDSTSQPNDSSSELSGSLDGASVTWFSCS